MTVGSTERREITLPAGDVAFVIADIEGSTRSLVQLGSRYYAAQDAAFRPLQAAVAAADGVVFKSSGDGLLAAFEDPVRAVRAAVAAQRELRSNRAPHALQMRVGVHVGPADLNADGTDYLSLALNQAVRVCEAGHGGQVLLSDSVAGVVRDQLPEGTRLRDRGPHLLKGLPEPVTLHELVGDGLNTADRPLRAARVTGTSPSDRTSFVGRTAELGALLEALRDHPAVTITGPGGVGKTRLLREALATVPKEFPDGAWLVPLADITDPALVPQAIAAALGVGKTSGNDTLASLLLRLRDSTLLIALDNCEQIVDATADLVSTVLAECPAVQFLLTSREPLNLPMEMLLPLAPLDVPADRTTSITEIAEASAVQLFAERALQVDQSFELTPESAAHIARICQLTDGLPLAIELVAPLVRRHTLAELVDELETNAIGVEGRARPRRQLSVRDSIAWSYHLLSDVEQSVFRRASVFAGGFRLPAARAVLAGGSVPAGAISGVLGRMMDTSLLTRAAHDRDRYRMLQTIRMFALAELRQSDDAATVAEAHARWYLDLLRSVPEEQRHETLAAERENLRAALTWAAEHDDVVLGQLVVGLTPAWQVHGDYAEGRRWMQIARSRVAGAEANALALAEGTFAYLLGDYDVARRLLAGAIAGYNDVSDDVGSARATDMLARLTANMGDAETARSLFDKALVSFRNAGDDVRAASVLRALGRLARRQGRYDAAARYLEEAQVASSHPPSPQDTAETLNDLGRLAIRRGDYATAAEQLQRALATYQELGDEHGAAHALYALSRTFVGTGDLATGASLLRSAIDRFRTLGDLHASGGFPLCALARVLLDTGDVAGAAAGFDEALRRGNQLGSDPIRMSALVGLADVSLARGDRTAAAQHLERARRLANAIGYSSDLAGIESRIAALGDPDD